MGDRDGKLFDEDEAAMLENGLYVEAALGWLGAEIVAINAANGWDAKGPEIWGGKHELPSALALIHSEVSEALEAYRAGDRGNFEEEMADVVIRVLDVTHGMGIDLGPAILAKLEKNRARGHRHGGKVV